MTKDNCIKYNIKNRNIVALAVLAVHESGCVLIEVSGSRVWFSPDKHIRNICIQCLEDCWVITWSHLSTAPEHKTYKKLLKQLKQMVIDVEDEKKYSTTPNAYQPDYAVHPGEILEEIINARGVEKTVLAERCGITLETVNQIIDGKSPISPSIAIRLEKAIGISASLWSNLNTDYESFKR